MSILNQIINDSRGKRRSPKGFEKLYENVLVDLDGDDVLMIWYSADARMLLDLLQLLPDLQICNGCQRSFARVTIQKPNQRGKDTEFVEEIDEELLEAFLTDADKYDREVGNLLAEVESLENIDATRNPPSKEEIDEWKKKGIGLVEVDMSKSGDYFFNFRETSDKRRCSKCGGGWWNSDSMLYK